MEDIARSEKFAILRQELVLIHPPVSCGRAILASCEMSSQKRNRKVAQKHGRIKVVDS
jgi:hypothetical protein